MAKWKDDIVSALKHLGGEAYLSDIYQIVAKRRSKKPRNWKNAVRYVLQLHNSDSRRYEGGTPLFYRKANGRWGLRSKD